MSIDLAAAGALCPPTQPRPTLPTLAVSKLAFSSTKMTPCCLAASFAFSSSCEGGCSPPATMHWDSCRIVWVCFYYETFIALCVGEYYITTSSPGPPWLAPLSTGLTDLVVLAEYLLVQSDCYAVSLFCRSTV